MSGRGLECHDWFDSRGKRYMNIVATISPIALEGIAIGREV